MHLTAKVIRISRAKFHCNRLTIVQYIHDYASLIFWGHIVYKYLIIKGNLTSNEVERNAIFFRN